MASALNDMPQETRFSRENKPQLLAPNGKPSKLTEGQWHQVRTPKFKKWYGDWHNGEGGKSDGTRGYDYTGRNQALNPVQRLGDLEANNSGAVRVGAITLPGTSGPVGADGEPVRFYHGTRDDITAFDTRHTNRLDNGWLGRGIYATSSSELADDHVEWIKRPGNAGPNTMPLFMAVRNPFVADLNVKKRLKNYSQQQIDEFTQRLINAGHDGVVMPFSDGNVELVAFEPSQVKSAISNNGDFDGNNPDIRFSRTPLANTNFSVGAQRTLQNSVEYQK